MWDVKKEGQCLYELLMCVMFTLCIDGLLCIVAALPKVGGI